MGSKGLRSIIEVIMEIVVCTLIAVGFFALGCMVGYYHIRPTENRKVIDRVLDAHVKDYHLRDKLKAVLKAAIH